MVQSRLFVAGAGDRSSFTSMCSFRGRHNLEVQISWQAQHFVNLKVQISRQAQRFVNLEV